MKKGNISLIPLWLMRKKEKRPNRKGFMHSIFLLRAVSVLAVILTWRRYSP
jgi:hypothetical protein